MSAQNLDSIRKLSLRLMLAAAAFNSFLALLWRERIRGEGGSARRLPSP